jgi:hypothetical protein
MSRIFEEFQHPAIQTKIEHHLGGLFHQIKVRQPIGRKDSIQPVCRRMRCIFVFCCLDSFQKFKIKIKNKNNYGG